MRRIIAQAATLSLILLLLALPATLGSDTFLSETVTIVVNAPTGSVTFVHPDTDVNNPKPPGVAHPDQNSYGIYLLAAGIIIGMAMNPQTETKDTDNAVFSAQGQPLTSGRVYVITSPPTFNSVVHFLEQTGQTKIKLDGSPSEFYWTLPDGTVITETSLPKNTDLRTQDHFLIEVLRDGRANFVFILYGFGPMGTMAAAAYYKRIFPQLSSYSYKEAWYVYRWNESNGNGIPDQGDSFTLLTSEATVIPEFSSSQLFVLAATLVVVAAVATRRYATNR